MKSTISAFLVIGSFCYSQFALSDCNYPKMNTDIPNGATATMEEMVAAQTGFKAYNADMNDYLDCLDNELAQVSENLDIYPDIKKHNNKKYDAAVDVLTETADTWNEAVQAYKAQ